MSNLGGLIFFVGVILFVRGMYLKAKKSSKYKPKSVRKTLVVIILGILTIGIFAEKPVEEASTSPKQSEEEKATAEKVKEETKEKEEEAKKIAEEIKKKAEVDAANAKKKIEEDLKNNEVKKDGVYRIGVMAVMAVMSEDMDKVSKLSILGGENPTLMKDATYQKELFGAINRVKDNAQKAKELQPSNNLTDVHVILSQSMDFYIKLAPIFIEGVKTYDSDKISYASTLMKQGSSKLGEATALMKTKQ